MENPNPYRAPSADVHTASSTHLAATGRPRRVRAGRGASWIVEGFGTFGRGVAGWFLAALTFALPLLLSAGLNVFLLGRSVYFQWASALVINPLLVVVWGGIMFGCHGEPFAYGRMLRGIATRWQPLAVLGVLLTLLGFLYLALVTGSVYLTARNAALVLDPANVSPQSFADGVWVMLGATFVLGIPTLMAVWFAPALVAVGDVSPVRAVLRSFKGCLVNVLAFAMFALLAIVMGFVGMIMIAIASAIVMGVTGAFGGFDTTTSFGHPSFLFVFGFYFILLFVFSCVAWAAQYHGFKEIFLVPPAPGDDKPDAHHQA